MVIRKGLIMKITKKRLRRIIKEMTISAREAEDYLRDRATSYERDGLQGRGMKMLLQDDFLDDLGHQHNIEDYEWLIDELVDGVNESIKITKRQLRKIIKEELLLENTDWALQELQKEIFYHIYVITHKSVVWGNMVRYY